MENTVYNDPRSAVSAALDRSEGCLHHEQITAILEALAPWLKRTPATPTERVLAQVLAERERQTAVEGWSPEHDDTHDKGEMAGAAAAYALMRSHVAAETIMGEDMIATLWPWGAHWWKPKSPAEDIIRAAALLVAELERLHRAAEREGAPDDRT